MSNHQIDWDGIKHGNFILQNPEYLQGLRDCEAKAFEEGLSVEGVRKRIKVFIGGVQLGLLIAEGKSFPHSSSSERN